MQLKWTDLADADLDAIEAYITTENSPTIAINTLLNIIDTVQLMQILRVLHDAQQWPKG